ncbi:divalent-cation tolerance protein CutA [Telmatospirillum sp.]|uniref:divalent-cation tolerance protein CutA n=1 Tax=Telmatospirillum sp. TaxID=2079197 RepID=UPI00284DA607|nr:divalent-cation tolerance protein CutA [Telmatospirillum sp.]MDR3439454.1 divalent-cation tolerance protein CutA [Telmatospirillum sp.]
MSGETESLVYVTTPDRATALAIARTLLEGRLIACANVLGGAHSLYWWDGNIEEAEETVMIAKTTTSRAAEVVDKVLACHPYDCPCVVTLPITGGNPAFLSWIRTETSAESD